MAYQILSIVTLSVFRYCRHMDRLFHLHTLVLSILLQQMVPIIENGYLYTLLVLLINYSLNVNERNIHYFHDYLTYRRVDT